MAYSNIDSLKTMVKAKAEAKGLGQLWPLIDYIITNESGWNPSIQSSAIDPGTGQRENSWGLSQCLIDSSMGPGLGANYTPEQLQDPEINAEIMLEHIRKQLSAGIPLQQAVDDWTVTHSVNVAQLVQGGATMTNGTATGGALGIPPEIDRLLEQEWEYMVSGWRTAIPPSTREALGVLAADEQELENLLTQYAERMTVRSEQVGVPKDIWKVRQASAMYGVSPLAEDTDEWDRALEEMEYKIEKEAWSVEKAATEFANRISAATTGGTLAQTAEQIRTSQMQRRMPAPNVPGGYQPIDPSQFTKYGMTAPQPVPVQPATFPDPWAEMERGRQAVGPTALPEMEFPPFPGAGGAAGGESTIIQAYNNITGGGAPPPAAVGMGPTPDVLARGMQPPTAPTPPMAPMPGMIQPPPSHVQPGMGSPLPIPPEWWERLYGGR